MDSLRTAETLDVELGQRLAERRDEPAARVLGGLSELGDQEPLYALSAVIALLGLMRRDSRLLEAGVRMGAAVGASDLLQSRLKTMVTRTRPHVLLDEGTYETRLGRPSRKPEQSFPSGHMAASVAAALALRRCYPKSAPYTLAACAILGWSRVRKAAHWPSDVAAGAVVGLAAEALSSMAVAAALPART